MLINNRTWNRQLLYQKYEAWSANTLYKERQLVKTSPWLNNYHIEPQTGLLNDPNGFTFFSGKWHLFYQHFPFGPVHGLKSWNHLQSSDLIHWKNEGTALEPDNKFDSHGVYSGSSMPIDSKHLFIMYTGNVRDVHWQRHEFQNAAIMDTNNNIQKLPLPLIYSPNDISEHFRDPMIFKYNKKNYLLVGSQKMDKNGAILLYTAKTNQPFKWYRLSDLNIPKSSMGKIVECPNLVFIQNHPVLIYCPQELSKNTLNYQNKFPNTYLVADHFNPTNSHLEDQQNLKLMDEGFDYYATQAFNSPDGRVLSVGWLGMPETTYPTDNYGYQGALSIVRELKLKGMELRQNPIVEMKDLRNQHLQFRSKINVKKNSYELQMTAAQEQLVELYCFSDQFKKNFLKIVLDARHGKITIDRSNVNKVNKGKNNASNIRSVKTVPNHKISIQLFIDASIFECFVNNGTHVMSGRVFPSSNQTFIFSNSLNTINLWTLNNTKK